MNRTVIHSPGSTRVVSGQPHINMAEAARRREDIERKRKEIEQKRKEAEQRRKEARERADKAAKLKQEKIREAAEKRKEHREKYNRETFNKRTKDKFNTDKGSAKERLRARQRIKSGETATDYNAFKYEMDAHPYASSAGRGLASGLSFGASELAIKALNSKSSKDAQKAERYYQKHKSKGAEIAGEMAGSLVGFGATAGGSKAIAKKAAEKIAPGALEKGTAKAVEKLTANKLIQRAAAKEAVKKFGTTATKEQVAQLARTRAAKLVSALGEDTAINLTTGLVSDLTHSLIDSDNPEEFIKNMGINAGMNVALGGVTSAIPALRVGNAVKPVAEVVDEAVRPSVIEDAVRPNAVDDAIEAEVAARNAPFEQIAQEDMARNLDNTLSETDAIRAMPENVPAEVPAAEMPPVAEAVPVPKAEPEAAEKALKPSMRMRKDELRELAVSRNIEVPEKATKRDILDLINKSDAEPSAPKAEVPAESTSRELPYSSVGDEPIDTGIDPAGDAIADARAAIDDAAEDYAATRGNAFDAERQRAYGEDSPLKPTETEHMSVNDASEIKGEDFRDYETHTKKGYSTISTSAGDKSFKGAAYDIIHKGGVTTGVYHDKDNYKKAGERVMKLADEGGIGRLVERFDKYANGKLKLNSTEQRDMIYDILAAVDFANANAKNADSAIRKEAEKLYLAACKAGAEQTSVSGLSLRQWQKLAMSSPEYRVKAVKDQILRMFNNSKGMRRLLGKGERGDRLTMEEFDDILKNNKALRDALKTLDKMGEATTAEEVENAASRALLEAQRVIPITAFDKLTQWRYVAMLCNPKTHVKNAVGNMYSASLGQFKDAVSSAFQKGIEKNIESGRIKLKDRTNYHRSSGGLSFAANRDSRVGIVAGIKLDNLRAKLDKANFELEDTPAKDLPAAKERIKNLEKKLADLEKNLAEKKPKRVTAAKAQEVYHNTSKEKLIMDAEKFERKYYHGKGAGAIDKMSKVVGEALETSDAVSVERIYREAYDKCLMANNYEQIMEAADGGDKAAKAMLEEIEEYAEQVASFKAAQDTYRNYNAISTAMNKFIKGTLYNYDAHPLLKGAGLGLHAIMPFTKVPVNIAKRGFHYSPVGLVQGKRALSKAIKDGDIMAINSACDRLAEGTIGTGIAALGMGLGFTDPDGFRITTTLSKSSEEDKMKKDRGYQDFAATIGNHSFTLEWATPTAATLFTGVEAGRMIRNSLDALKDKHELDFDIPAVAEGIMKLSSDLLEPNLQLTMFQGINRMLENVVESDNYEASSINPIIKMVGTVFSNYAESMLPSVVNSLSRSFAPYDYFISGENDIDYRINAFKAKIPIASNYMFGAKTTGQGEIRNAKEGVGDYVKALGKNLLSPANISKIYWDGTDDELLDLYKKTGNADVLPKNFYKRDVTIGKGDDMQSFKLNNKELAEYNVEKGKSGSDAMQAALESVIFNRWERDKGGGLTIDDPNNKTPEQKKKLIKEFKDKGAKDVFEWVTKQPEWESATDKEKEKIVKSIYGTGSYSNGDRADGARRASQRLIAKKNGVSATEYDYMNEVPEKVQSSVKKAISDGIVSQEEVLDAARYMGRRDYETNDSGGSVTVHYSKERMMQYLLEDKGYSEEKAEAIYDAFRNPKAKSFADALKADKEAMKKAKEREKKKAAAEAAKKAKASRGGKSSKGHKGHAGKTPRKPTKHKTAKSALAAPKNVKGFKATPPSTRTSSRGTTDLAQALNALQETEAKVAPPKARRQK